MTDFRTQMAAWSVVSCVAILSMLLPPTLGNAQEITPDAISQKQRELLRTEQCAELATFCEPHTRASNATVAYSAHMCMANAALCGKGGVTVERAAAAGVMRDSYAPKAIQEALAWVDRADKVLPNRESTLDTRIQLHLLERNTQAITALIRQASAVTPQPVERWLRIFASLYSRNTVNEAIAFGKVLESLYPDSHKVHGYLGGAYTLANRDEEAQRHLEKAVALAPKEAINRWNLARLLEYIGQFSPAEKHFVQAIADTADPQMKADMSCTFSTFVKDKMKDEVRAKKLAAGNC